MQKRQPSPDPGKL